jgi:hypothetical protein
MLLENSGLAQDKKVIRQAKTALHLEFHPDIKNK